MRQEDQLWNMDDQEYVHFIFDYAWCMMLPSWMMLLGVDANEIVAEIGPCDDVNVLN